ncbi:HNH endonuclease [Azohydromonas aeria]|uniref:HNH endonuclease n=1 Tax=Azohydromonas aeria TaxID=2590212 RepID=UPI0035C2074B
MHPLCVRCSSKQRVTLATCLDHVKALANGGDDFFDPATGAWRTENAQSLCDDCHKEKSRKDLGYRPRPRIGLDGWPVKE